MYKLYSLRCPETNELRYIGQTKQSLQERLWDHCKDYKRKNNHRACWIASLAKKDLRPSIHLLHVTDDAEYIDFLESKTIREMLKRGHRLVNTDKGVKSRRRYTHSAETRAKISANTKLQDLGIQVEAMRRSNTGRIRTDTERQTIRERMLSTTMSDNTKTKISLKLKALSIAPSEEARKKAAQLNKKPIIQKDLLGNFLQEFDSQGAVMAFLQKKSTSADALRKAILKQTPYKGYLWELKPKA